MPVRVDLCDVGPRDGLQNEPEVLAPAIRAELVERLAGTGLPQIEVASFVRDDLVPQMADAEAVVRALAPHDDVTFAGLVLNTRGYERLRETTLREVHVSFAASETFQQRNAGGSIEQGLAAATDIVAAAHADRRRVSVTLSTAFGCPFEGSVDEQRVIDLVAQVVAAGADEILLADTIGVAVPTHVSRMVGRASAFGVPTGVHLHDTRNTAVACAWAAVEAGATILDSSVGGIGGCPFAPRSTGNVATEDLVYLLEREGVETGVDLDRLISVAVWLEEVLGRPLAGKVYRAGS
jgi:hydroxymethylglutaryl-CoA lyase/(R)-citramalyl-CoA lyase